MGILKDLSIRHKLTAVTMLTSCIVVLLAATVFVVSEVIASKRAIVQELSAVAQIIGRNSTAALLFDDETSAKETLSALPGC